MSEPAASPERSLYQHLGGYDVIAAIVDDLFARLRADARFARFGQGRSVDSHRRARQLTVDQLCALAGGPCVYIGRDMKTAHEGLAITEGEWEANMGFLAATLDEFGIAAREKQEVLALFAAYKKDIVEDRPAGSSLIHR